jgi:hypothetical protein
MFSTIEHRWQIARAVELRSIAQELVQRIANLSGETLSRFTRVVAVEVEYVLLKTQSFRSVSKDGIKQIARGYRADAKNSYDLDIGASTAKALIASLLEASALPGDDARYVRELTEGVVTSAINYHGQRGRHITDTMDRDESTA